MITVTVSDGAKVKKIIVQDELVSLYDLDTDAIIDITINCFKTDLLDSQATSAMIENNLEVID